MYQLLNSKTRSAGPVWNSIIGATFTIMSPGINLEGWSPSCMDFKILRNLTLRLNKLSFDIKQKFVFALRVLKIISQFTFSCLESPLPTNFVKKLLLHTNMFWTCMQWPSLLLYSVFRFGVHLLKTCENNIHAKLLT